MKDQKLQIIYVLEDKIHPWDKNPKEHDLGAIRASVRAFGPRQPIHLQEGTGLIIAGHGRFQVYKEQGMTSFPVIYHKMNDKESHAYALADNQTTIAGGWNEDLLAQDLKDLKIEWPDLDMTIFGFDEPEMDIPEDADEVPEPPTTPTTKPGDLYIINNKHRVLCGDSTKPEDMEKLMDGKKADMVFTDPPYSVGIGKKNRDLQTMDKAGRVTTDIEGDNSSVEETAEKVWKPAFELLGANLRNGGAYYITAPQGGDQMMMMMMMMMRGSIPCRHELIWVKNQPTFSMGRLDYDYKHEPILYGWKGTHKFQGKGNFTKSVWEIDREQKCNLHPTMKPIGLVMNAIYNSSSQGEIILDPFLGSGTTLIAAEQTNRVCYGMEIDPKYCDVIVQRYKNQHPDATVEVNHDKGK